MVTAPRKFAYPPNLVVVDGGAGQVAAAAAALADLGIDDVSVCGLAKRLEEVWLPGQEYPVIMSRSSEGLYLLQRVRDEAHRFAITYHRAKRGKAAVTSALDSVPGLGPARRAALLKAFGSVKAVSAATPERDRGGRAGHRPEAGRDGGGGAAQRCQGRHGFPGTAGPGDSVPRATVELTGSLNSDRERGRARDAGRARHRDHHRHVRCRAVHRGQVA